MKAIVYDRYGSADVLRYEEIPDPVPGEGEVLIRVRATSVNPYDWHWMRGTPFGLRFMTGLRKPKSRQLGVDVAGEVEAVGRGVTKLKAGDAVFGACKAAFAEYVCTREGALVPKPANVTFNQAGCVAIAGFTAMQGLRDKARLQAGQKILINGAAGGVGTFAVQIAKWIGAEVTGVCSTRNVEMVRSIGADHVVDYTREDFTRNGRRYDVVFDCIGNHSLRACRGALSPAGICAMPGGKSGRWVAPMPRFMAAMILSRFSSRKLVPVMAKWSQADLILIGELMDTGKVTPVLDRSYPLREVAAAVRYLEEGHARGKVVITVG